MSKLVTLMRTNKVVLKCCSLLFGYFLWTALSERHTVTITMPLSIAFLNTEETKKIEAPEIATVTLSGTRRSLIQARTTGIIVCDATKLIPGKQTLALLEQRIVLPQSVTLVNCNPHSIPVTVTDSHIKA